MSTRVATTSKTLRVLVAEDSIDDQLLISLATDEANIPVELAFVDNGLELMWKLWGQLENSNRGNDDALPDLILLDLRMPLMDGYQVLSELQYDAVLWQIPVVVLSSSSRPVDVALSHTRGAVRYETKPSEFSELVEFSKRLPTLARHHPYCLVDDDVSEPSGGWETELIDCTDPSSGGSESA